MSLIRPKDGWDRNASSLLRRRIFEGSPDPAVNYAPDTHYDSAKHCNVTGPLTVQIGDILLRHADLWAQGMRENPHRSVQEARSCWRLAMREADAEIKRYVAGPTFKPGAAA